MVQPSDFLMEPPKPEDYMAVDTAAAFMDRWAAQTNQELGMVADV